MKTFFRICSMLVATAFYAVIAIVLTVLCISIGGGLVDSIMNGPDTKYCSSPMSMSCGESESNIGNSN